MTAESNLSTTSIAFMFSTTCSGLLAPVMTVLTCGFFRHQANPNWDIVQLTSLAMGSSLLTFAMFSGVIRFSRNQPYPSSVAREPGGIPLLYLPVKSPEASGLQMVVPSPISLYNG